MPQVPYTNLLAYRLFSLEISNDSHRVFPYWNENSYAKSETILAEWLTNPDVLAMRVPSSVMPDEINYLFHPAHVDYQQIRVVEETALVIDPRLWDK